ncbi:Putative_papain-like cysteine peptidase (DUF1796) [Hexamita inflata]|uniref:Papain-like cysteine peptidase (DUF1796) n=1 Tax=Hexamita inflata TaxID=28002 RepID=A0AA86UJ27_9EUKA|nr:Putative papain-like cysteine peptidase (DUF1796) [Hexamita inflata]
MNTILKLSDAEYFCSWSSTAFHDASRVSLQMKQMELDNTNVSVLKQVPTYHYEDGSVTLNEDPEQQLETILFRRDCLENVGQYSSFTDLALQIAQRNAISYVSHVTAYLDLSDKYTKSEAVLDESTSKHLVNLARPKQRFDAVISLGAWCQVSLMAEWRQLYSVQSPFIGFGFFQWERLLDVLESNFSNYWEKENMEFGKATPFFSFKYNDERPIHHVYDNHYNMFSCHHFDECDCTVDRLAPYQQFKIDLNRRIDNFRQQCLSNRSVLFNLKIFNKNVSSTTISESQLLRLVNILNQFRNGNYFELRISVPPFLFEETVRIIRSNIQILKQFRGRKSGTRTRTKRSGPSCMMTSRSVTDRLEEVLLLYNFMNTILFIHSGQKNLVLGFENMNVQVQLFMFTVKSHKYTRCRVSRIVLGKVNSLFVISCGFQIF